MDEYTLASHYYLLLDALPEHVFVFSEQGQYLEVFGGQDNHTQFDCKAYVGQYLHDVMPLKSAELFLSYIQQAIKKRPVVYWPFGFLYFLYLALSLADSICRRCESKAARMGFGVLLSQRVLRKARNRRLPRRVVPSGCRRPPSK